MEIEVAEIARTTALTTAILGVLGSFFVAFLASALSFQFQKRTLREELKLEYSIETAIRALLSNPNYKKRGFKKIRYHLRGFETDDELRRALIRAGAVAFSGQGDEEMWGLIRRNPEDFK
ncbi:MAG: hypothetical protein GY717_10780 [Rhodobacteraceae bacterium]|nr:hypothetical protein [Paracoccaceae bacterium]